MKKAVISIMIFVFSLLTCGCGIINSVELNQYQLTMYVGDVFTFTATLNNKSIEGLPVLWTSSHTNAVAIDQQGHIQAIEAGTSVITVQVNGNLRREAYVTVQRVYPTAISLSASSYGVTVGDSLLLQATYSPIDAIENTLRWFSSNETIAYVNNQGVVRGIKVGVVTITVSTANNISATARVSVYYDVGDYRRDESITNQISTNGTSVIGSNSLYTDIDNYDIQLTSGYRVEIWFTCAYEVDLQYYRVSLFNSDAMLLLFASKQGSTKRIIHTIDYTGLYRIKVSYDHDSPYYSGGNYVLYVFWE